MADLRVEKLDIAPIRHDLMINELVALIGCAGCRSCISGYYLGSADRSSREGWEEDMRTAADLTGVPITFMTSSRLTVPEDVVCADAGSPCQSPEAIELFQSLLGTAANNNANQTSIRA